MEKKQYTKPTVNKVKFVSKNTILGFCHSSPNMFPNDGLTFCQQTQGGCANPPTQP
jgi:hypothetical protein